MNLLNKDTDLAKYDFSPSQYYPEENTKTQIYLHHTAGNSNGFNVFKDWESNPERIATCVTICGKSSKNEFKDRIYKYRDFLVKLNSMLDKEFDSDLLNVRDELLGDINQFLYLLTFDK